MLKQRSINRYANMLKDKAKKQGSAAQQADVLGLKQLQTIEHSLKMYTRWVNRKCSEAAAIQEFLESWSVLTATLSEHPPVQFGCKFLLGLRMEILTMQSSCSAFLVDALRPAALVSGGFVAADADPAGLEVSGMQTKCIKLALTRIVAGCAHKGACLDKAAEFASMVLEPTAGLATEILADTKKFFAAVQPVRLIFPWNAQTV